MTPAKRKTRPPHLKIRRTDPQSARSWGWVVIVGANGETMLAGEIMRVSDARRCARRLAAALGLEIRDLTTKKKGK